MNWNTASFSLTNMTVMEKPVEEVCRPFKPGSVIFPEKKTFRDHVDLCYHMRGRPTIIRSKEQQEELSKTFWKHISTCEGDLTSTC